MLYSIAPILTGIGTVWVNDTSDPELKRGKRKAYARLPPCTAHIGFDLVLARKPCVKILPNLACKPWVKITSTMVWYNNCNQQQKNKVSNSTGISQHTSSIHRHNHSFMRSRRFTISAACLSPK